MANERVFGFRWSVSKNGGPPPVRSGLLASGYNPTLAGGGIKLKVGTPIVLLDTGYYAIVSGTEGTPGVLAGIMMGVDQYWDGTRIRKGDSVPNSTTYGSVRARETRILYTPVEAGYWEADADDAVTATTYAAWVALRGSNVDHVLVTGTEPDYDCALDISSHTDASPTSAQWRIEGLADYERMDLAASRVKLIVSAVEVQNAPFTVAGL